MSFSWAAGSLFHHYNRHCNGKIIIIYFKISLIHICQKKNVLCTVITVVMLSNPVCVHRIQNLDLSFSHRTKFLHESHLASEQCSAWMGVLRIKNL